MGVARISTGLVLGSKRRQLEHFLLAKGHTWRHDPRIPEPWSGQECMELILAFLDGGDDPEGWIADIDMLEFHAVWPGKPGLLVEGLLAVGFLEKVGRRHRWHDYESWNGNTIRGRIRAKKYRDGVRDDERDGPRDGCRDAPPPPGRDGEGNAPRDGRGGSGSGSLGRVEQSGGGGGAEGPGSPEARPTDTTKAPSASPEPEPPGPPRRIRAPMPTAADPASFVDRTADVLHECAGGTRDFARSMATEILERVENDRGFFATHLAENLPRPGAALDVWKRELVKAWVDRRDAAAQERSLRAQATRDDRAAREATAKREFDAAFAAWVAEGNPESVTAYRKHRASLLTSESTSASCGPERRAPQTARRPLAPAHTPPP